MSATPQLDAAGLGSLLGTRLRERRRELGRTLAQIAQAAGVSTGYLSSIEKGASVPSLPVLARLAHALEVSLAEMLRTSASARLARGSLGEALARRRLAADGSRLQIVQTTVKPGEKGRVPLDLGQTDVFVFVHDGSLEIVVDGETFELAPGDSLHCDLPVAITWRALGDTRATVLWAAARTS